jgi:hypothetical protein
LGARKPYNIGAPMLSLEVKILFPWIIYSPNNCVDKWSELCGKVEDLIQHLKRHLSDWIFTLKKFIALYEKNNRME